jgi:predicted permease
LLLVTAGLFLRTLDHVRTADPGFSMRQGILASVDLLPGGYDDDRGCAFYRNVLDRLRAIPGVRAASLVEIMPLNFTSSDTSPEIEGYTPAKDEDVTVYFNRVAPGYFDAMGIPLMKGRAIDDRDVKGALGAVVINETMARRYWKGHDPIGGHVRWGDDWMVVVGVVKDGKYETWTEAQRPYMYVPLYQRFQPSMTLIVRTDRDPTPLIASVQREVRAVDPRLPIFDVRTMEEHLQVGMFITRMAAILLGVFGAIALLLATTGLYGVLAQLVAQRTREVGIRMALGAKPADVLRMVIRQGLATTSIGLALGLALAAGVTRLVSSQLIGVGPHDPLVFLGTATLLIAATIAASYLPARRAASQDPLTVLRHE